jgi:hypothetical protein
MFLSRPGVLTVSSHLQAVRHGSEDADINAVITNHCYGASPEGGLIFHIRGDYTDIDIDIAFLMAFSCGQSP